MDIKAVWDLESTEIFVNACVDEIYKKERKGQSFTPTAWKNITSTFTEKTGKPYGKKQFKNRLDILKKELRIWDSLIRETGVGRDPLTGNVLASSDWWKEKLQEHSEYKKFRYSCLKNERELRIIFKDGSATGDHIFSTSRILEQTNEEDEDDVYRPTMDEQEGSGDSEDEHFGAPPAVSTGVTEEMASVGLAAAIPSGTGPSASGSSQKRKRGEGRSRSKKQKLPAAKQIADAVSVIANVTVDRATALTATQENSMPEVMKSLLDLDDVKADKAFGVRCMRALESKTRRDVFVSLKGDPEYLMTYLRYIVDEE